MDGMDSMDSMDLMDLAFWRVSIPSITGPSKSSTPIPAALRC